MRFTEKQRFNQLWLWIPLVLISLLPLWGVVQQVIMDKPFGNNPMSNTGLIIFLIVMLMFLYFIGTLELRTQIDSESIRVRFWPFGSKTIPWNDIESAEVLNYGFVGGWGLRIGTKYGTVYNTSGKMGLALKLKNGRKLCIGTQRPSELSEVTIQILEGGLDE